MAESVREALNMKEKEATHTKPSVHQASMEGIFLNIGFIILHSSSGDADGKISLWIAMTMFAPTTLLK